MQSAIKLAEHATHSKSEIKTDMDSLVTSVIALVAITNIIYMNNAI